MPHRAAARAPWPSPPAPAAARTASPPAHMFSAAASVCGSACAVCWPLAPCFDSHSRRSLLGSGVPGWPTIGLAAARCPCLDPPLQTEPRPSPRHPRTMPAPAADPLRRRRCDALTGAGHRRHAAACSHPPAPRSASRTAHTAHAARILQWQRGAFKRAAWPCLFQCRLQQRLVLADAAFLVDHRPAGSQPHASAIANTVIAIAEANNDTGGAAP
jgi:hypothetical protein